MPVAEFLPSLGMAELIILVIFPLVFIGFPLYAAIDAAITPSSQWAAADRNQGLWVALILAGTVLGVVPGLLFAIAYFAKVRPALKRGFP